MKINMQLRIRLIPTLILLIGYVCSYAKPSSMSRMNIDGLRQQFEQSEDNDEIRSIIEQYANKLDEVLANDSIYQRRKRQRISKLVQDLNTTNNPIQKYRLMQKLFEEYKFFSYDSTYRYSLRMSELAKTIGDKNKLADSQLRRAEALTLGGFFRQAEHTLNDIDTTGCSAAIRIDYLICLFNMNYENGFYYPTRPYEEDFPLKEMTRIEAELKTLISTDSPEFKTLEIKKAFHNHDYDTAIKIALAYIGNIPKDTPEYAEFAGNLGYNLMGAGMLVESMKYMTESAIYEIENGSKGYPAIRKISEMSYIVKDLNHAYKYASIAMDNYKQFGSKYRITEISIYYPTISEWMHDTIEGQQRSIANMTIMLSVIVVLLIGTVFIVIKQWRTESRQKNIIARQNTELVGKQDEIAAANMQLQRANRISYLMLGQMLTSNAHTLASIEKVGKNIALKLKVKDYDGIRTMLDNSKLAEIAGRNNIAKIILTIFPDFVAKFNELLKPEARTNATGTLTPEMKTFALVCLGITKNDDIAKCLDYSVNTIKSYKTKVVNNALFAKEEFYERLKAKVFTINFEFK